MEIHLAQNKKMCQTAVGVQENYFAIPFGAVPTMQRLLVFAGERRRVAAACVAENVRETRRLGHKMPGTYIQTLNVGAISFRHPVLLWRRHPAVSLLCAPAGAAGDLCKRAGCCPAVSAGAVDSEAPHLEVESRRGFGRAAAVRRSAGTACAGAHLFCAAYAGRSKKYPADLAAKNQPD